MSNSPSFLGAPLSVPPGSVFETSEINILPGGRFKADGTQPAALTAQLTTITPADAEGTPDYAIAAITNTTPYGFASAQEAITVLHVIKNLQVRVAELEARLESLGIIAAN
jgi:hypothetical protein